MYCMCNCTYSTAVLTGKHIIVNSNSLHIGILDSFVASIVKYENRVEDGNVLDVDTRMQENGILQRYKYQRKNKWKKKMGSQTLLSDSVYVDDPPASTDINPFYSVIT